MALILGLSSSNATLADQTGTPTTVVENCGTYLFEWGPVDYDDGHYLVMLVDGNTISENDIILNRGYDYPYTFDYIVPRPQGETPQLASMDGVQDIPENQGILPGGSQPTLRIAFATNNKILSTKGRYIGVIGLPQNINPKDLPAEVRRYLINVGGSDTGAYDGTTTAGWEEENSLRRYRKSGNTYVSNTWLKLDDKQYYMNEQGVMLVNTIIPDGYYVNTKGKKTSYIPDWLQDGTSWKYIRRNGYYAANRRIQSAGGEWYCFDMAAAMLVNATTSDGYYVDANGVWDRRPTSVVTGGEDLVPGTATTSDIKG